MISVSHWYNPARSLWGFKRRYMVVDCKVVADSRSAYPTLVQSLADFRMFYMRLVGCRQYLASVAFRWLKAGPSWTRLLTFSGLLYWGTR